MRFYFTSALLFFSLSILAKEKNFSKFTYTGTYNPSHRASEKTVSAEVKKREAFWAAFCNVAVHLSRLQDEVVYETPQGKNGWYVSSRTGMVDILAISIPDESEIFHCRLGDLLAIETKEGELHSFITSDFTRTEKLRNQKWPAHLGGIFIRSVKYRTNCEKEDCECEITVRYP